VFVKSTKDPLRNISKLDYLKIFSINQKGTFAYKDLQRGIMSIEDRMNLLESSGLTSSIASVATSEIYSFKNTLVS
jgi:hypothetical protein